MALDEGDAKTQTAGQEPATIDMRFVPTLPGGRSVIPVEHEGRLTWLIAEGAMTEQCLREMRAYLVHIASRGMWTQNWNGTSPQPA